MDALISITATCLAVWCIYIVIERPKPTVPIRKPMPVIRSVVETRKWEFYPCIDGVLCVMRYRGEMWGIKRHGSISERQESITECLNYGRGVCKAMDATCTGRDG